MQQQLLLPTPVQHLLECTSAWLQMVLTATVSAHMSSNCSSSSRPQGLMQKLHASKNRCTSLHNSNTSSRSKRRCQLHAVPAGTRAAGRGSGGPSLLCLMALHRRGLLRWPGCSLQLMPQRVIVRGGVTAYQDWSSAQTGSSWQQLVFPSRWACSVRLAVLQCLAAVGNVEGHSTLGSCWER